jgi:hypothetical protein
MSGDEGAGAGAAPAERAAAVVGGWGNVPARDPAFTGREEQLAAIRAGLLAGGPVVVYAAPATGGNGKTQVAIEYAHRHAGDYALTWWLDCENRVLLGQQYAELAISLGHVARDDPPEEMRRAAISALRQHPSWLLVFDNVTDPATIRPWLPDGPGHVLITSYKDYWNGIATTAVPLGPLSRAESVQLLRRRVPGFADGDAGILADSLGDLPLTLALASAWIAETGSPPAEYVRLHAEHAVNLWGVGRTWGPRDFVTPVVSLAWTRLRFLDPDAALLAATCAYLARWPIPVGWLTAAAAGFPAALAARLADDLARPRLLDALTRSGLARLDDAGLTMHRTVQSSICRAIPEAQEARACATTIITANVPPDPESPAAWPAWARLYPHLPALSPRRQDTGPALDDAVLSAVRYLISSGNASEAETRASRLHESWGYPHALGPDHEDTLRAAAALAAANRALGRHGLARVYGTRTLTSRRRLHGDDHPGTLTAASDLADILSDMGDHEAARELDDDTLRRRRRVLGKDHPDTRRSAGNLARDLRALGETGWRGWRAGLRRRVTAWSRTWRERHRAG